MAQNKIVRVGPVALTTTTTTNILNPPTVSGGTGLAGTNSNTYLVLRHLRIVNTTAAAITVYLYLGGSTGNVAGTQIIANATSVAANSYIDWYGMLRMDTADYLVGGASATGLVLQGEAEIGLL